MSRSGKVSSIFSGRLPLVELSSLEAVDEVLLFFGLLEVVLCVELWVEALLEPTNTESPLSVVAGGGGTAAGFSLALQYFTSAIAALPKTIATAKTIETIIIIFLCIGFIFYSLSVIIPAPLPKGGLGEAYK
jgi:hypothetical protein